MPGGVGGLAVGLVFADIAEVLEGDVGVAVQPGQDVGLYLSLDAEGAHFAEVLVARLRIVLRLADHVAEVIAEEVDL